jgi:uncharacterized protein with PQ loop repeat
MASLLGVFGPAAQFLHVWRSKSTKGLSLSTFTILNLSLMCSLLLGVQYAIGAGLIFGAISLIVKLAVLWQISARVALALIALAGTVVASVVLGPPIFSEIVLTTRYSELVAFTWGLLLAIAFMPQVWLAHKTRNTRNLSLVSLSVSAVSTTLWTMFAVLVANYAMMFWCAVMLISLLELVRLKVAVGLQTAKAPRPKSA